MPPTQRIVVTDANVLINLMHVSRISLFCELDGYEFVIPDHVLDEITRPEQREELNNAIASGAFSTQAITDLQSIELFTDLIDHMGKGEAACLAVAVEQSWVVASDERGRFRREAINRIGAENLIGTADIYVLAIRQGLISVTEADGDKAVLEAKRFRMPFTSFADLISP